MFACYVNSDEFYAAYDVRQWVNPSEVDQKLRNASAIVANDLRSRGVITSRLMPPTMLVGTTLYEYSTVTSDTEGTSTEADNVTRLVIKTTSSTFATFGLQGSKDGTTWDTLTDMLTGNTLAIEVTGAGLFSGRFFEMYPYYRLTVTTDESVTFTAYLVDSSVDELIIFKTLETAMFLVLDIDTRTQQLYDASRAKYQELISSVKFEYDADDDGATDGEFSMQRRTLLHR